jgi:hypothetical protein
VQKSIAGNVMHAPLGVLCPSELTPFSPLGRQTSDKRRLQTRKMPLIEKFYLFKSEIRNSFTGKHLETSGSMLAKVNAPGCIAI